MSDSEGSGSSSRSASSAVSDSTPIASTSKVSTASSTTLKPTSTLLTTEETTTASFSSLGLIPALCDACSSLGFTAPSQIQQECIPYALQGKDIIGLAQTGSGKTAAFALPILQALWEEPQGLFAVVLAPTRLVLPSFPLVTLCEFVLIR